MALFDSLFGGTDTSAQDITGQNQQWVRDYVQNSTEQQRADALRLFPQGDATRNLYNDQALGLLDDSIQQQIGLTGRGNVGAQEMFLAGQPQYQNAILGNPVDMSGMGPVDLTQYAQGFDTAPIIQQHQDLRAAQALQAQEAERKRKEEAKKRQAAQLAAQRAKQNLHQNAHQNAGPWEQPDNRGVGFSNWAGDIDFDSNVFSDWGDYGGGDFQDSGSMNVNDIGGFDGFGGDSLGGNFGSFGSDW